jgi:hypothetical protein
MITASSVGVLVVCVGSEPYAVPMNHAYSGGKLYFHCAPAGRKLDMIQANPRVCYVVNRDFGRPGDLADSRQCHGNWESVIVQGRARIIRDPEELRSAFLTFGRYFRPDFTLEESALQTTAAIIVEVDSMTARREVPGKQVSYWSWSPGTA